MILAAIIVLCVNILLLLVRAIFGETAFDKILAINLAGTAVVLVIACLAFFTGDKEIIDVALVYALLNFIATIGFLKFFKFK